jgi:hypothetical protein
MGFGRLTPRIGRQFPAGGLRAVPLAFACLVFVALSTAGILLAQFQGYGYPGYSPGHGIIDMDGESFAPENPNEHAEWTFARFRYTLGEEFGSYGFQRWAADYPKSDRQFIMGVKRLTRINARSTEHIVDADHDELFNYPWIYVEDPGAWRISTAQAKRLRQYVDRGGFIMLDDSWGDQEYATMQAGVAMILPGYPIEEIPNNDPIFHVVYDLNDRVQVPGTRHIWGRRWPLSPDMVHPRWMGVRDDKGRIVIAICQNSDVGDAWEWADSPRYPEKAASLAYRLGINYIIYSMTH